jgi:elongation factor Ts
VQAVAVTAITAALVKELRTKSGAGMMDCKKALVECNGDFEAAEVFLRNKGLASADKKSGRIAVEGAIVSYVHTGSRVGVLIEVNCESDFVARGEAFKEFAEDMAMQVAADADITVIEADDVPEEVVERQRELEMAKEDLLSKPEGTRAKIVEGRLQKFKNTQVNIQIFASHLM